MADADKYLKNSIVRVNPDIFAIAKTKRPLDGAFANIIDDNETTVIAREGALNRADVLKIDKGWRLITFEVVMPFDVVGFLARVAGALAEENIPIFAISTYSTDNVLVKEKDLDKAVKKLQALGCRI